MNNDKLDWYISTKHIYDSLAVKVESIIRELIEEEKIPYHGIYSRSKDIESLRTKINKKGYSNPKLEIHDLAGIRIISYVESDLNRIIEVVKNNFKIDLKNSVNKSDELGVDKVGYQSIHFIAELKSDRVKLAEYKKYKGIKFEFQIRTILQHAWAEIEHDRNYKFRGQLPNQLKRRFTLLAGTLELVDREFNAISSEIDKISESVISNSEKGNLDFEINSTTLNTYLNNKINTLNLREKIQPYFYSDYEFHSIRIMEELGIDKLSKLDVLMTDSLIERISSFKYAIYYSDIIGNVLLVNFGMKFLQLAYTSIYPVMFLEELKLLREHLNEKEVGEILKIIKIEDE